MPARGKRRALGQHFLRDPAVQARIVTAALELAREAGITRLLEIGPGKGAITSPLLERLGEAPSVERLLVCEKDRELATYWTAEALGKPRLSVLAGDFLELSREQWMSDPPPGVVSNLPYSAGTAILDRLARERIPFMVLMFQAEVAQRLRAVPSTKAWGSLSIWVQNRWDVSRLCAVPRGAFSPPPEVESEVVILRRRKEPRVPVASEELWEGLLKACFAHRRKMLRSALSGRPALRSALESSGVSGSKRAEALDWTEWAALLQAAGH
jgi:16S rRNA (adenine1518-N6/adenine1519-N6)-dimethyltransferase